MLAGLVLRRLGKDSGPVYPLFLLDLVITLKEWLHFYGIRISLLCTVYWDPLSMGKSPVKLAIPVKPRKKRDELTPMWPVPSVEHFYIKAGSESDRRLVAWVYRWHDILTVEDWRSCLSMSSLNEVPLHALVIPGAGDITVKVGLEQKTLKLIYKKHGYPDSTAYEGDIPMDGLSPSHIISTALSFVAPDNCQI